MLGANDIATKGLADSLMPQADAKDGHFARHVANQRHQNPRLTGCTGAGREQNAVGAQRLHLFYRQLIVAANLHLGAQFSQVLHEVVGKRIVVVEHKDHSEVQCSACGFGRRIILRLTPVATTCFR